MIVVPPTAPEGYKYFPDVGYYKFYPAGVDSFLKAKKVCENDGAHLAIINSDAEAEVLMEIYKNFPEAGLIAYLGFHDMRKEGEFETIFVLFYCKEPNFSVPPPKPAGYEYFPGVGYYKFYPDGVKTFNEALNICQNDGAHLAIINSVAESEVLKFIYARFPKAKEWAYLGFHDLEVEGKFVTISGE
ncbi:hypothetical protein J437_LFUL008180 [Ladona fulva]|uniref:C-type lectin domain-containing protein n=1 Tax=Ladona fulva TaxID=123851 RepID=A0A8K0K8Q4_LADFU|nr:hypothetical protein J437_LFUL008180 [Ladona fulva]